MGLETIAISKAKWVADGDEDAWPGDPGVPLQRFIDARAP